MKDLVQNVYGGGGGGVGGVGGGDTDYMYALVQDAISGKSKLRQRREKGQPCKCKAMMTRVLSSISVFTFTSYVTAYSDTDSEWSSLERRQRAAEVYCKVNRKSGTHKRARKKRTAIPVQPPRVPQLQSVQTPALSVADEADKAAGATDSNSESSEVSDVEQYQPLPDTRHRFQKGQYSLKKRLPIPASVPIPPELHNAHNLNIQLNSTDLFAAKLNSYGNVHDDESSLDVSSPRDNNSPMVTYRSLHILPLDLIWFFIFSLGYCQNLKSLIEKN